MERTIEIQLLKEEQDERIERAELLYEYQTAQYKDYLDRLHLLEEKGLKVFGSISVVVTALVLIVRFGANVIIKSAENHPALYVFAFVTAGLTFVGLCSSWAFVFRSVVLIDKPKLTVDNGIDEVFMRHTRDQSLVGMADMYAKASKKIEKIHNEKAYLIGKSFEEMQFTGWSFVIFVIIIAFIKIG